MKNGGNTWPLHWRRFIEDVLISTSTVAMAFAAIGATADARDLLILGASALIGIGLMLEPNATEQPASDIGPQPFRPATGPNLRDPGSRQWGDGIDAAIVEATSV